MRLLLLGDLPPFVLGGAERQLMLLAKAWQQAGHEILVLGHRTPTGVHDGIPARRIRVAYRLGRLVRGLTFGLSLGWNLLREHRRADVIYCRFLGEAAVVTTLLKAAGLVRTPLFVTPAAAGEGAHSDLARLRASRVWPFMRARLRGGVRMFNAISPAIERELRSAGLQPISAISNGVQLPAMPHARDAPAVHERFWLFCGRFVPQKGADLLLEAMARPGCGNFRLLLAGEGPDEAALRAASERLGLSDRVSFLGRLSHPQLLEAMRRAYALVLPSRYEGLSNAALEALGAGLPVVSTRCGGIDAYLGEGIGWVCEPTAASLATALRNAGGISAAEWQERSRRSRDLAERTFGIERCAAKHLALFARLSSDSAPAPADTPPDNLPPSVPR